MPGQERVEMGAKGCFCCGCPVCMSMQNPSKLGITLSFFTNGTCDDCSVLNGYHELDYINHNMVPNEPGVVGCCVWRKYVRSECAGATFFDEEGFPAYRIQARLCVQGCTIVDDPVFGEQMHCDIVYSIEIKGDNVNPDGFPLNETFFQITYNDVQFPQDPIYPQLNCCTTKNVGLVFDDGGPTCDGDEGSVQTHAFDACWMNNLAECQIWDPVCGEALTLALQDSRIVVKASGENIEGPNAFVKAKNVSTAYVKWAAAGFPKRSPERIQEIFDTHCQGCKWFVHNECRKCGCPVTRTDNFRNKLLWATEACPLKPPKWEADA